LSLDGLAEIAGMQSEYERASTLYGQALEINREIGSRRGEASCLYGLASIALMQSENERASTLLGQALEIARAIKFKSLEEECLKGIEEIEAQLEKSN
jgi:tetratricopeptide (TPR) repeat protein